MKTYTKSAGSIAPKVLAYLAGEAGLGTAAGKSFMADLEKTPRMIPGESMLMKLMMGVNPFMPIYKEKNLFNAYFNPLSDSIHYDTDMFNKPGVMAHELGHKLVHEGDHGVVLKFLQDALYGPSRLIAPFASIPLAVGAARKFGRNPLTGLIAGGSIGALASSPYLASEWAATDLAKKKYLNWRPGGKKQKENLDKAFNTYLAAAIGGPAALGAITSVEGSKFMPSFLRSNATHGSGVLKRLSKLFKIIK